ncbi:DUF6049 family protein [Microbacterium sp. GXF7504]
MSETLTSAHAGSTATRLRRGLLATVLTGVVLAASFLPGRASAETTPTPTPTLSGEVTTVLSPVGTGVVRAGETLGATVTVDNGTSGAVPASVASLLLADAPLGDEAALQAWLAGEGALPAGTVVATSAVDGVASGTAEAVGLTVAPSDPALTERGPGVYPVWADVAGHVSRSVVVIPSGAGAAVGVVVPITAGVQQAGLLGIDRLETLTGPDGALTAQLEAVAGTDAILAVDPALPAAIRALGTRAPESATSWLRRLETLPNTRFALQFGDADVSPQLAAGLAAPLQPTSLAWATRAEDFPEPQPSPSATPSEDLAPPVPDLETLLDVGPTSETVYWPGAGSTTPGILTGLAAATPGSLTLVTSAATEQGAAGATVAARGTTPEGADLLVYDTRVSEALQDAAAESDATMRGAALAAASAYLAFATADAAATGRPLLVAVERGAEPTRSGLRSAIAAVTTLDGVTPVDLPTLVGAEAVQVSATEGVVDASLTEAVPMLLDAEDRIGRFATILDDPSLLTGQQRAEGLQLLSTAWTERPDAWGDARTAYESRTSERLTSVSIVPPTSINLLTAGTNLKFWIHNSLPYPANVVLSASPDDLRLSVDPQTSVVVAAADSSGGSNTPVEIPVRARIANGEVQIFLSLHSATGEPIGVDQVVDVNVRADWENVGLVLMALLVAGFLTVGVIRTVRRRRAKALAAESPGDDEPAEPRP